MTKKKPTPRPDYRARLAQLKAQHEKNRAGYAKLNGLIGAVGKLWQRKGE